MRRYKAPAPMCDFTLCGLALVEGHDTTDADRVTCGRCRDLLEGWSNQQDYQTYQRGGASWRH
jgi:hypothetical protein